MRDRAAQQHAAPKRVLVKTSLRFALKEAHAVPFYLLPFELPQFDPFACNGFMASACVCACACECAGVCVCGGAGVVCVGVRVCGCAGARVRRCCVCVRSGRIPCRHNLSRRGVRHD